MATFLRATVMLIVLVGLPSCWVYYGPLPPEVMGMIERTLDSAKQSLAWSGTTQISRAQPESPMTAPRFDVGFDASSQGLQQYATAQPLQPSPAMRRDDNVILATASLPAPTQTESAKVTDFLSQQLEPHLELLRSLDASRYRLEQWGADGQMYRFSCSVALAGHRELTRQFEAVHADPLQAVHQVVGEVTAWQNARLHQTKTMLH